MTEYRIEKLRKEDEEREEKRKKNI